MELHHQSIWEAIKSAVSICLRQKALKPSLTLLERQMQAWCGEISSAGNERVMKVRDDKKLKQSEGWRRADRADVYHADQLIKGSKRMIRREGGKKEGAQRWYLNQLFFWHRRWILWFYEGDETLVCDGVEVREDVCNSWKVSGSRPPWEDHHRERNTQTEDFKGRHRDGACLQKEKFSRQLIKLSSGWCGWWDVRRQILTVLHIYLSKVVSHEGCT